MDRLICIITTSWFFLVDCFNNLYAFLFPVIQEVFKYLSSHVLSSTMMLIYFGVLVFLGKKEFYTPAYKKNENKDFLVKPLVEFKGKFDPSFAFQQPRRLIFVGVATLFIIELLNTIFMHFLGVSDNASGEMANRIAIASASVSILFPVALLIVDGKDNNGIGSTSKSQTLLSYSLALPLGIVLLAGLGRNSFELHPHVGSIFASVSIIISAWVFYRLVRIVIDPSVKKTKEEKIIKHQVLKSIKRSAEERGGLSLTIERFKDDQKYGIDYSPFSFSNERYTSFKKFESGMAGVIDKIDVKKITSFLDEVIAKVTTVTAAKSDMLKNEEEQRKDYEPSVKLSLRCYPGQEVGPSSILAELFLDKKIYNQALKKINVNVATRIIDSSIDIKNTEEQGVEINQYEDLCNNLRTSFLNIVKEKDVSDLSLIERYLGAWLDSLADAFDSLGVRYNLKTATGESTNWFFNTNSEWQPLKKTLDIIEEAGEVSLKNDFSNQPEMALGIINLTNSLFLKMIYRSEILSARQLLVANLRMCHNIIRVKHAGANYLINSLIRKLESFSKYAIVPRIQENCENNLIKKDSLELVRLFFSITQEYLRCMVILNDHDLYTKFYKLVEKHPSLNRHDNIEHDIKMLEMMEVRSMLDDSSSERLAMLRLRKSFINKIENWRSEICIGQISLVLMGVNNEASDIKISKDDSLKFLRSLLNSFRSSLQVSIQLIISISRSDKDEKWGWNNWEKIDNIDDEPSAKWMQLNQFLDDALSLVLIKSATSDRPVADVETSYLHKNMSYKFDKSENSIRKTVDKNFSLAQEIGIIRPDQESELKTKINNYLDRYVEQAESAWKANLVKTPLDSEILSAIPINFDDSFISAVRLRPQITFESRFEDNKDNLSKNLWGSYKLYQREMFVKEDGVHYPSSFGKEYGAGFARSEDEYIFTRVLEIIPPEKEYSFLELLKFGLEKNMSIEKMFFWMSRDPEFVKKLKSDTQYEPIYRATKEEIDKYCTRPDGFYLYEGNKIPIYQLFLNHEDSLHGIILAEKEGILVKQVIDRTDSSSTIMSKSGFVFKVRDPLIDIEFNKQLISEKRDWLEEYKTDEEKRRMAPIYIGMSFWQRIDVEIGNKDKLITSKIGEEDFNE